MTENLPQGSGSPVPTAETIDFSKIVEKSIETVNEAKIESEIKRGRGRPRKHPKKEESAASMHETPQGAPQSIAAVPMPDFKGPLAEIWKSPFEIMALKTDIPDLKLEPEQSNMLAEATQNLLNVYFPDLNKLDEKKAAIFGLVAVAGSIFLSKYQIYALKSAENSAKKAPIEPELPSKRSDLELENIPTNLNDLTADNFFKTISAA